MPLFFFDEHLKKVLDVLKQVPKILPLTVLAYNER